MKKIVALLLILAVGLFCYKRSGAHSYVGTFWSQTQREIKDQVPTRFELARARHELEQLDGDIGNMIRPIAEHMAAIGKLKKDIQATSTSLDEQKIVLLTMTKDLEGNPTFIEYAGEKYPSERVRSKLQRDFESYKRLEAHLHSQRKLLEAKETSLKGAQDQLAKVIAKKREFELRLAQAEAEEETLQVARLGSKLQIDDSRATQIEAALAEIEQRHEVERHQNELKTGTFANDAIPVGQKSAPSGDPAAIRRYLESAASPVALNSSKN